MPILEVELVGEVAADVREGLAQRIADAAGAALDSRPQGTWVKLRRLPSGDYAENGGGAEGVRPVFVRVLESQVPRGAPLVHRVAELTTAVAEATGRPRENVHVLYEPPAAGRVAFGGWLLGQDG